MVYILNIKGKIFSSTEKRGKLILAINGTDQDVDKINTAINEFYKIGGTNKQLLPQLEKLKCI